MKPGRNDLCPCGSGQKYKRCCGRERAAVAPVEVLSPHEIGALVALIDQNRASEAEHKTRVVLKIHPNAGMLWKILSVALLRQGKDALVPLRRTAELLPHDAEAHSNLGTVLHDRGEWGEALVSLRRALGLRPRDLEALIAAANATKALGRPRESVALYQRALQLDSRSPEAQNNLGNAFLELGRCDEAVACYRRALGINPGNAEVHCNLGNALRQLGHLHEAIACSRQALALDPRSSVAHNNLGLSLAGLGQREPAVASYRQALLLSPNYVQALNNLGNVLCDLGERREAVSVYRKAIDLDPERAESFYYLGNTLFELRRIDEAETAFRRALVLRPKYPLAQVGLAAALRMHGRNSEAQASCHAAQASDANCVEALSLLGELQADRGQFAAAQELFQRVIALDPGFSAAFCSIAAHRKMTQDDTEWLQGVEALLARKLPLGHEISLRYALGKYFDDVGQYDPAFDHYRQANQLTRHYGSHYDQVKLTRRVDHIIGSVDAAFMHRSQAGGSASELPVFIIGMPRSGTSLAEQILASHPAVFGAGELRFWDTAFAALENAGLGSDAAASLIPGMVGGYLDRVTALSGGALRVIDKMPANFLYAGLIHAAFPRARIIHMRRHPIDTCLSIYFQNFFNVSPYANDLDDLAHYYGEYVRVTDHWRSVLPASTLLEIHYETVIADQEGCTRRMLDFIGLPWDSKCLDFQETERVVITASKWQVRQKIHTASANRWRHYEKYVAPLRHLAIG
jgi:tetratricopeptide (TPR) repeat protein